MKFLNLVIYGFTLLLLTTCCCDDEEKIIEKFVKAEPCFFFRSDILSLMRSQEGVRFYNAKIPKSYGNEKLMAVGVKQGADAPIDDEYIMFLEISNDANTSREKIDKNEAQKRFMKNGIKKRYAATFSNSQLGELLHDASVDGILLLPTINIKGFRTLIAMSANIDASNQITAMSNGMLCDNPCPINCGVSPEISYLAPMGW